jgi:DNA-binding CsgD family transcriptional regulator
MLRLFGEALELPIQGSVQRHLLGGLRELISGIGVVRCLIQTPGGLGDVVARADVGFDFKSVRPSKDGGEVEAVEVAVGAVLEPILARCREPESGEIALVRRAKNQDPPAPLADEVAFSSGIGQALVHVRAIGQGRFDGLGVYRAPSDPAFSEEDLELIRLFHHEVLSRFAMPDQELSSVRLSPREQQTLSFLLRGARRKEIAAELGLSQHTVNEYVKSLYKRLGVSGLPELYFRFASDGPGTTANDRRRTHKLPSREVA